MVTCLCNALSCCKGGARATRVCTGICTWAVQHLGIGKGVLSMGVCAKAYTGIAYISLTQDWYYEFVKWL